MSSKETTRLIPSSPPPAVNQSSRPPAASSSSSNGVMSAVSNVFQLVHGAGESVRGRILGAIDDWESKGEQKHHTIARQGEDSMRDAFARLRGTAPSSTSQAGIAPSAPQPEGYTTGYDAAPPSYGAREFRPDVKN
ncbi:hypothetical protein FB45DRAFT_1060696 [Roridomyces roridus]|uniref:Uncharacterized protein n=1 Tax=Roridomyces roridus TaxID=1738132 RepID=A0AAD7BL11_9AGAR|nr:hypothetical protein FB45DRAFT_1060696 [Roridomyces roridus]